MKKIIFNCIAASKAGTFTVAFNLLRSLAKSGADLKVLALVPSGCGYEKIAGERIQLLEYRRNGFYFIWRIFFDQIYVPLLCLRTKADVLLNMNNIPSCVAFVPQILMLQQANIVKDIPVDQGVWFKINFAVQKMLFSLGLRACDAIIVQTPVMKDSLLAKYSYPERNICVIRSGYDNEPLKMEFDQKISSAFYADDYFKMICVSHYYPAKNLELLLEAAVAAKKRGLKVRFYLTVDRDESGKAGRFVNKIGEMGLEKNIVNLGRLTKAEVFTAYRKADAFILPTLLESFGLIYLEAMSSGLPVLTSDLDFARYVCGDAALYFDPRSADSVLDAIIKISTEKTLRMSLIENGQKRIRYFFNSWDNVAKEYLSLIENCAKSKGVIR